MSICLCWLVFVTLSSRSVLKYTKYGEGIALKISLQIPQASIPGLPLQTCTTSRILVTPGCNAL
jgi:hypothetical protein